MISFQQVAETWNAFFHAVEPPYALALFRILFGCLLLVNALFYSMDARLWLGPNGLFAPARYREIYGHSRLTLLRYLPDMNASVHFVLGLHIVSALSLTLGFLTEWSAAVTFVSLASLQHRNPLVTYGADDVMRIMAFLLVWSRAGEVASVDQWLQDSPREQTSSTVWCTRLMQLQVSIVYLQAFLAKFSGAAWLDGSAVYYAIQVPKYQRRPLPLLARTRAWSRALTWGTMLTELGLGPLVWIRELRVPVLLGGIGMHLGMEVFMNLHLFGPTMLVCFVLFLTPAEAEGILRFLGLL